jgi:hypothetical protein
MTVSDAVVIPPGRGPTESGTEGRRRVPWWAGLGAATVFGWVLGGVGWTMVSPGGSLLGPALVVLGAGVVVALVALSGLHVTRWRGALKSFVAATLVFAVLAAVWTFEFALPVAMEQDAHATNAAQALLARLSREASARGGPAVFPCEVVKTGAVGPLTAPYSECATSTGSGHFVTYNALDARPMRGIGYTDVGGRTFPDECVRHLVAKWWMYVGDASGIGNCPFGYHFVGGG